ncbi:alpha/beta fold hydrolase [Chloroflexi bacterium TSY]|nr:alpha/beta fold hydrolase [Chloroflexi bacterium TSY]
MAVEIVMPKWGMTMQEGTIGQWLIAEGEAVEEGQELVEIESDKITNVVEAPASGILGRIVHPAGTELPIGQVIAFITAPGEAIPEQPADSVGIKTDGLATSEPPQLDASDIAAPPSPNSSRIRAMPVARRMAKEHGLDLSTIEGTGPNGSITKTDVEQALVSHVAAPLPRSGKIRAMPAARRLAKEHGLDLATIRGTGPNGAITSNNVRQALATSPIGQLRQKVAFYSEGHRLDGLLFTPKNLVSGEKRPGVVLCVGYTYLKELTMPDIAKALNAAGYVALTFDYRGFGGSEGPRHRLMPQEQVTDVRAALTFLADQPHVDTERLAIVGLSLGGSHAISAAAIDRRVSAVIAIEAPGDGERWLRSLRRHYEWQEFQARVAADRVQRMRTGQSNRVDPMDIVLPDPASKAILDAVYAEFPHMQCDLPLETADALIDYRPEAVVDQLAPRPLLLIHGEDDRLVPADESRQVYAQAGESAQLEILPGLDHFNWVMPEHVGFAQVTNLIVNFLSEHLIIV